MLSEVFAGVREKLRDFAIGRTFSLTVEGDLDGAARWGRVSDALHTDADQERFNAQSVETSLNDVVYTAKKFEFTKFDDDPQAAIEKAVAHLGNQADINGNAITVQRVMDHLGLDFVDPETGITIENIQSVETSLNDVVYTAKKFEFTKFDDDPQAAIEKAVAHLGNQADINGDAITVERVMAHLGLEYVETETSPANPYPHLEKFELLNQAIGGGLWDDPDKNEIYTRIDNEMSAQGASWDEIHEAVVREINGTDVTLTDELTV